MPLKFVSSRLAAACVLALVLCASFASAAVAKGPVADMRVIGAGGNFIAEGAYGAATATVKTTPKATCFGPGTGGSGKSVTVKGPTALGMLILAAQRKGAVQPLRTLPGQRPGAWKPLLITDAFDFGLGLCGIGGAVADLKLSWYLKVNHKNPEKGDEMVKVKDADDG